jgi:flagellar basal body-associated protein FliL
MADDKKKEASDGEEPKKKGPLIWIILAVVLGLGGVGAGVFLAPKFMTPPPAPAGDAAAEAPAEPEAKQVSEDPPVTVQWPPLVVDVRDEHGGSRHIKIVITLEAKNEKLEEELRAFGARGRQAVLGHVRAQKFEELIDPDKFEEHQKKITELVQEKVGKNAQGEERVQAVLITDLVAQ